MTLSNLAMGFLSAATSVNDANYTEWSAQHLVSPLPEQNVYTTRTVMQMTYIYIYRNLDTSMKLNYSHSSLFPTKNQTNIIPLINLYFRCIFDMHNT